MRFLLRLALYSALNRRWTLGLTVCAVALSAALLLGVERIRHDARASFVHAVSGTDLIVGARTGGVQLLLYSVFHIGAASNNISWSSYNTLTQHPAVAWTVPVSLGDSHRGAAVIGTSAAYFSHFRYADDRALQFAAGRPFNDLFEVVAGSEVAQRLGYALGQQIVLSHGASGFAMPGGDLARASEHADKPFTLVGVLAATGTPVDRSVFISLESMSALHLDWLAGAPLPGVHIPAQYARKFDLAPREITAALVGLKRRADVFRMQRFVNEFSAEPLLAVLPGVTLDELWQVVAIAERTLLAVSAMVMLVSLAGLVAVVLASLNERRRELAILRSVGARPADIFFLLGAEGLLVTLSGALLGMGLLLASLTAAAPWLQSRYGLTVAAHAPNAGEWQLLGLLLATGLLAGLVPAWRAYRLSLSDGLTPRL